MTPAQPCGLQKAVGSYAMKWPQKGTRVWNFESPGRLHLCIWKRKPVDSVKDLLAHLTANAHAVDYPFPLNARESWNCPCTAQCHTLSEGLTKMTLSLSLQCHLGCHTDLNTFRAGVNSLEWQWRLLIRQTDLVTGKSANPPMLFNASEDCLIPHRGSDVKRDDAN